MKTSSGLKAASAVLSVVRLLQVAINYANFQNFESAIKYAELALEHDHYHKEARALLEKWSEEHKEVLRLEVRAVQLLSKGWKERVWAPGFRMKLKLKVLQEIESAIEVSPYDMLIRWKLSYYGGQKWRSKLLFETQCALRIQRVFRIARMRWNWQSPIRARYVSLADAALEAFLANPLDRDARNNLKKIISHSMCPKKHPIFDAAQLLFKQDRAVERIRITWRCHRFRLGVFAALEAQKEKARKILDKYATIMQCCARCHLARKDFQKAVVEYMKRWAAAIKIQAHVRRYRTPLKTAVLKALRRKQRMRAEARALLRKVLPRIFRVYRARKERKRIIKQREAEKKAFLEYMKPSRYEMFTLEIYSF